MMNFYLCSILAVNFVSLLHGTFCVKNETINIFVGQSQKIGILEKSSHVILVNNIPPSVSVVLFEVHSHIENVTLSETEDVCLLCSVTGKNIGLTYKLKSWESEAHMWLLNNLNKNITIFIKISALDAYGPIPGGCNMEFNTEIAPYLRLQVEYGKLILEFQHANIGSYRDEPDPLCSLSLPYISYDIYVAYLKENDFSESEYFNKIDIMSNSSLMKHIAKQVQTYSLHPDTRSSFLMYPNIGVVFNVIAKYTVNGSVREACYVPISSYGCGKFEFTEFGCNFSYVLGQQAFLFLLSMYGFLTAYFGHMFFSSTMFFFGFLAIFFITLVLTGRFSDFSKSGILKISGILGILGGGLWLSLWIWLHNSLISLLLIGFVFGFLISATILYSPVGNYEINVNDKNYWLLLSTGSLFVTVLFLAYPSVLSILGSSVVGSYVMLLFYDDFIGTKLAYIILNIVKRAVSENLTFATNNYPFETKDILVCCAWAILSVSAVIVQSKNVCTHAKCELTCFQKLCCCKSSQPNVDHSEIMYSPECSTRQPLLSKDTVFYNTFTQ